MSLNNVWLSTLADGLVRADQVIGVHTHSTPALSGKASRWLLDVMVPATTGSGQTGAWSLGPAHRTLTQTHTEPRQAPATLARLLAQLDATSAAGIITIITDPDPDLDIGEAGKPGTDADPGAHVRFRFSAFATSEPDRHDELAQAVNR